MELKTVGKQTAIPPYHVIVEFGAGIPYDIQGPVLLALEKMLRIQYKIPAEVFKPTKADDSKLRSRMTEEERAKL